MKTPIVTLFTVLTLGLGITKTTYAAAPAKNQTYTVLTNISAINKIEVHGNVELYVSDGEADLVKVYNKYYNENALIQSKDGVLRITSYKTEKLVIWVTANDLRSITAFDNAEVKSFGKISKIEFNVDLYNNASAKLDLDVITANVMVNDKAKVNLSGTINEYDLKYSNAVNVDQKDLAALHSNKTLTGIAAVKGEELADL
jgi:hypothetical protein